MYHFILSIQYIGILVLFIQLRYLFFQTPSKLQNIMIMLNVSLLINFVGYLFEIRANSKDFALMAVKFIYLGKPFVIYLMVALIIEYFNKTCNWRKGIIG